MTADGSSVSVVIPVLNAKPWLADLLAALTQQPAPPREIISRWIQLHRWHTGRGGPLAHRAHRANSELQSRPGAQPRGPRSPGELLALLTRTPCPRTRTGWPAWWPSCREKRQVVAVYSRQVPRPGANPMEQFFLAERFPAGPRIYRQPKAEGYMLVEDVFFSNVAALIRRETLVRHPFHEELIMSGR